MNDLVQRWMDQNKLHCLEGTSALQKVEKLLGILGYRGHSFRHGSPIEEFLSDCSAAVEALLEAVSEQVDRNSEFEELLKENVGPQEEEEAELLRAMGSDYVRDNPQVPRFELETCARDIAAGAELFNYDEEGATDIVFEGMMDAKNQESREE